MKPDNIKRRTAPRRPKGYCGNWERHQTVKARELKTKIRYVRKRIDKYVKIHPEYMHSNQKKDPNNSRIDTRSPCLTIPGRKSRVAGSPIRLAPEGSAPAEMPKMRSCVANST